MDWLLDDIRELVLILLNKIMLSWKNILIFDYACWSITVTVSEIYFQMVQQKQNKKVTETNVLKLEGGLLIFIFLVYFKHAF